MHGQQKEKKKKKKGKKKKVRFMLNKYILPFNYFTPLSKGWGDHKFHRWSCNFTVISRVVKDATQYHNGINRVLFHPLH